MNKTLLLGAALAALASAGLGVAVAQPEQHRMIVRHGFPGGDVDTNHDGWLSRAEASAAADRTFADLDTNHDGRLNRDDHADDEDDFDVHVIGPHAGADADNCTTTVEPPEAAQSADRRERRVTVICHGDDSDAPHASGEGRHVRREVTIIRRDNDDEAAEAPEAPEAPEPPEPPMPPRPPHPPMFMMLANAEEADTNGDGALSRDEFRAQQLRFFDASDANGDGKIRFTPPDWVEAPPIPPVPPIAPVPPVPPTPAPPPRHH